MRVVLIEDQALLSSTLALALAQSADIEIVAQSDKASEALELCSIHMPDMVLMDVFTNEGNGIACTAAIKKKYPSIKVLIMTGVEDERLVKAASDAGADIFTWKNLSVEELTDLVRYAKRPYRIFPNVAQKQEKFAEFSQVDLHILKLLARGRTSREIAEELYLGYGTVRLYISRMYASSGMKSRAQLVAYALRTGLIEPDKLL